MNRAFFTRDYADLLDRSKFKEAVQETTKKQPVGVTDVTTEATKKKEESKKSKQTVDEKEEEMKRWVTSMFGCSFKILFDKLDNVDRKSKLEEAELEELRRLRAEKELRERKELASNDKRKRGGATPDKVRMKSVIRIKSRQPRRGFGISDDEEGGMATNPVSTTTTRTNLKVRFDQEGNKKDSGMDEIKGLLKELIAVVSTKAEPAEGKGKQAAAETSGNGASTVASGEGEEESEEEQDELGLAAYMHSRVENYKSMHYTHVRTMCLERGVSYIRKELGIMELARLDLEEYMRSLKQMECNRVTVTEPPEQGDDEQEDRTDVRKN
ncbi:hypothetical protein CBR_g34122 [Chara braunii]|uniref:Uncharacterized protein n=1 Tax=Chara braunii TaxID=69332 RepID=A0A388LHZ8_CHABU|nr:hypothetical protein CBR_g34122 [Chara braunii]|eukprot:GBG81939.1 hypothetical protein CBR_g34122 [Chara braunii]